MSLSNSARVVTIIPSYNTGPILEKTVRNALNQYSDVWLLIDGSNDGSQESLRCLKDQYTGFKLIEFPENRGKGAVLLEGAVAALEAGFTHCITMDSDGQHPPEYLPKLAKMAIENPSTLVMGRPVFDETVPQIRLQGRKLTIALTHFETGFYGLGDTLYGFRVYPLEAFVKAFAHTHFARGYDFDPEIAVRIFWQGVRPIQMDIPVKYIDKEDGGVSHFHYVRDNIKMVFLHFRLIPEYLFVRYWKVHQFVQNWRRQQKQTTSPGI